MTFRSSSGGRHQTRQGQQVFWLLLRSRCRQQVTKLKVSVADRLVQRHLLTAGYGGQALQDLVLAHIQALGQLGDGGGATQALVQLVGRPTQPQRPFLERARHMQAPAGIP